MTNIQQMEEHFADQFMQPQIAKGKDMLESFDYEGTPINADDYYCRLSADGFLDCTDWHGPFDSVEDCANFLLDAFAHDLEG